MRSIMPLLSSSSVSNSHEEMIPNGAVGTGDLLFLNVYDITPFNNYLYWIGLGVFHSGIEVYGSEYAFGCHDLSTSGVFEVEPKCCPRFSFRRSLLLGRIDTSLPDFRLLINQLSGNYHGNTYNLIEKNCNHFTNEVSTRLIGKPIPGWVNRLARLGSLCSCLLPKYVQATSVRHMTDQSLYSEDTDSEGSLVLEYSEEDEEEEEEGESLHHLLPEKPLSSARHIMQK